MDRSSYFEELYAADPDPWAYETSTYEADKYRNTLGILPSAHYGNILEIGCSIGVLSRLLAERCDHFLGLDVSVTALQRARAQACAGMEFRRMEVPGDWPGGKFDLIVLSEVLYYLDRAEIALVAERCRETLLEGGHCVAVNWRGSTGTPLDGETASNVFAAAIRQGNTVSASRRWVRSDYILDLYE